MFCFRSHGVMHMYVTRRLNHWSNNTEFRLYCSTLALDFLVLRGVYLTVISEGNKTEQQETESSHWIAWSDNFLIFFGFSWLFVWLGFLGGRKHLFVCVCYFGFVCFDKRKNGWILAISRNSTNLYVQLGYYCSRYIYPPTLHPRPPNHFEKK